MIRKQLGGCAKQFTAKPFNKMAQMNTQNSAEMFQANDEQHLKTMREIVELMNYEGAFEKWFIEKERNLISDSGMMSL